MPDEYIDYVLCNKFGWTPTELDKQDSNLLDVFIEIMKIENREQEKQMERVRSKHR